MLVLIALNLFVARDISNPLPNSFIHTGHGAIGGNTWGDPQKIDEYALVVSVYLLVVFLLPVYNDTSILYESM